MAPSAPEARWTDRWLVFLVCIGAFLRLSRVSAGSFVWFDEAAVSINIVNSSFRELTAPMPGGQIAPVGYLWAAKLAATLLGSYAEWVLRIPALLSGIGLLGGMAWVSRRILPPWGAVAATGLTAFAPSLLYYSWEIKQYSTEAAVTLVIAAAALLPAGRGVLRPLPRAMAVAALAPWFSMPCVFVLPGLLYEAWLRDPHPPRRLFSSLRLLLTASAVCSLVWARRVKQVHSGFMNSFHGSEYAPFSKGPLAVLLWLGERILGLIREIPRLGSGWPVAAVLGILGLAWMARNQRAQFRVSMSTLVLWLFAGVIAVYPPSVGRGPHGSRLSLFLMPLIALAVGAGVGLLETWHKGLIAAVQGTDAGSGPRLNDRTEATTPLPTTLWVRFAGWFAPAFTAALLVVALLQYPSPGSILELKPAFQRIFSELQANDVVGLPVAAETMLRYHRIAGKVPEPGPLEVIQTSGWTKVRSGDPVEFPPETKRVWWLDAGGMYGDNMFLEEWKAGLHRGFVRVPLEPLVEGLSLWSRKDP